MIRKSVIAFLVLILGPGMAFSATDDFRVRQQIGIDTTPPTVPDGVTTTPVTTTQINVVWGTSTDAGVGLKGYQVYRDGVQIATTAPAVYTYSDTGLTPSTTYAYQITAFDEFFNISAFSTTSATTTLAPPEPPILDLGSLDVEMMPIELVISGVQIGVEDIEAIISFDTSSYAITSVRYGTTPQYELGSLASVIYEKSHQFTMTGLEPNRQHFFEITATNQRGDTVSYTASFVTKTLADVVPPANVSGFTANADGDAVELTWVNPPDRDFDRVRVIANHRFYPLDLNDGELVYEGSRESFRHEWVYPENSRMYYTIFALDEDGNQSSGAITQVRWVGSEPFEDIIFEPFVPTQPGVPPTDDTYDTPPMMGIPELSFDNLEFIQNARVRQGLQSYIDLDPNQNFTVRIPYELVPENLKTITVTLVDPDDPTKIFAFLLRINERKTHYEATIGALRRQAEFPLRFALLDFSTKEITTFGGIISTVPKTGQRYAEAKPDPIEHAIFVFSRWWWWLIILLLLLTAYWLMKD